MMISDEDVISVLGAASLPTRPPAEIRATVAPGIKGTLDLQML